MAKICPHGTTGRADYFGSAVNRAARLLCAAQAGQVLVEEHVLDSVITDWRGDGGKPKSCPWVKGLADASIGPGRSVGKHKLQIDVWRRKRRQARWEVPVVGRVCCAP